MSRYAAPRPIEPGDDLSNFDSGEPSLDEYLRKRALANHIADASRCFITCAEGRVVGYHSIAAASVNHVDLGGRFRRNMPNLVPVLLISRLAVDINEQGRGLGKHLLRDAIQRCIDASEIIGARAILVHALHDDAQRLYRRFDFEESPTDLLHMLLLMGDARLAAQG